MKPVDVWVGWIEEPRATKSNMQRLIRAETLDFGAEAPLSNLRKGWVEV